MGKKIQPRSVKINKENKLKYKTIFIIEGRKC